MSILRTRQSAAAVVATLALVSPAPPPPRPRKAAEAAEVGESPSTSSPSTTSTAPSTRRRAAAARSTARLPAASSTSPPGSRSCAPSRSWSRAYSFTVAAGDLVGASPLVSAAFHDEPTVDEMNALGLDVTSVGNHEFDEGVTELLRLQNGGCHPVDGCQDGDGFAGADYPMLAANVVYKDSNLPILAPYTIENVGGVKVGFVGMTLEGTPGIVNPAGITNVKFLDEATTANWYADELRHEHRRAVDRPAAARGRPAERHARRTRAAAPASPARSPTSCRSSTRRTAWSSAATRTGPTPARCRTRPGASTVVTSAGSQRHGPDRHQHDRSTSRPRRWSRPTRTTSSSRTGSRTRTGPGRRPPRDVRPQPGHGRPRRQGHRGQVPHRGGAARQPGRRLDHRRHHADHNAGRRERAGRRHRRRHGRLHAVGRRPARADEPRRHPRRPQLRVLARR